MFRRLVASTTTISTPTAAAATAPSALAIAATSATAKRFVRMPGGGGGAMPPPGGANFPPEAAARGMPSGGVPSGMPGGMPPGSMPPGMGMEGGSGEEEELPPGAMEPTPRPAKDPIHFNVSVDPATQFVTISLKRPPVNSLSLTALEELNEWLAYIGDNEEYKALILTSSVPHVFSAGLDIAELYQAKEDRLRLFWLNLQDLFVKLNTLPKPTVAAINGNCPAAGCVLTLSCDYRVMVKHVPNMPDKAYRTGLNETKVGMIAPPWAMSLLGHTVGRRRAEKMLQLSETPTAAEALAIGLVDEAVATVEELNTRAVAAAKRFAAISAYPRWLTRDMMRAECMYPLADENARQDDVDFFVRMLTAEEVQKSLGAYLERLRGGVPKK